MDFTVFFYLKEEERRLQFIALCDYVSKKPERKTTMALHFKTEINTINEFALRLKRSMRGFELHHSDCIQICGMQYRDQLLHTPFKVPGNTFLNVDNFGDFI